MLDADNPLSLLVARLERHSGLDDGDRDAILALPYSRRTLEPSTYLVREGDPPTHCGVIISGFAFRQKLSGAGARQIVALHIPGEATDLQNLTLDVADHNIQTLTRADVALVPRAKMQQAALSRPGIAHAFLVEALIEASIFREWILNVGRRDSRTRLAHLLCEFAVRLESAGLVEQYGYELPMTQEQLGDALGLTPVHVNRTIRSMEAEGLIRRAKRFLTFPDWERIRDTADFSDRYLHLGRQKSGPKVG